MGDELHYDYKTVYDEKGNKIISLSPDEYLKIPQMYHVKFKNDKYIEKVKSGFANECNPNEVHDLIIS